MHGEQEPAVGGVGVPLTTQDAAVDAVLAGLADVAELPLSAQVALLDDAHQQLQDRLARSSGNQSGAAPADGARPAADGAVPGRVGPNLGHPVVEPQPGRPGGVQ